VADEANKLDKLDEADEAHETNEAIASNVVIEANAANEAHMANKADKAKDAVETIKAVEANKASSRWGLRCQGRWAIVADGAHEANETVKVDEVANKEAEKTNNAWIQQGWGQWSHQGQLGKWLLQNRNTDKSIKLLRLTRQCGW
jgi:hypothetical protein